MIRLFYFAEELSQISIIILMIKVNDRATMLNLMQGLFDLFGDNSGIICEEYGDDCNMVPIKDERVDTEELCKSGI